ncbi:SMC-Scp complex subunit ScpB [Alteromonas lipolytica]|uniref:SMC-Scp complex subunit ScpB n=1 Tax=Alteromonas lipolytica TaxID=1856405 RepID=A0A1E8FEY8_9ALTE|nr:SMC-Scp complex subunit ScpB [Alteromonas lipolytica]OFI34336.1 SMC-Scp complex subunit ScpB [Alteromonas lipolytica]GGF82368.1 segregation and condensation protein B [Alteromonas lipolytica]
MKKINAEQLKQLIEATIFVSDQPVSVDKLKNTVLADFTVSDKAIQSALKALTLDYAPRGIQLVEVASGYRFQSLDSLSPWLSRLWQETSPKYSRAMLETLALIAYRQPITRGEIEQVRGVAVSSNIIKTLTEREWIKVVGHKEVPGRPALYATTKQFLDYFSLKSLSDLPNADDFMAALDASQNSTHVLHTETSQEAAGDSDNHKESIH